MTISSFLAMIVFELSFHHYLFLASLSVIQEKSPKFDVLNSNILQRWFLFSLKAQRAACIILHNTNIYSFQHLGKLRNEGPFLELLSYVCLCACEWDCSHEPDNHMCWNKSCQTVKSTGIQHEKAASLMKLIQLFFYPAAVSSDYFWMLK